MWRLLRAGIAINTLGRALKALHDWIAAGAPWPEGEPGKVRKKDYRVVLDDYL